MRIISGKLGGRRFEPPVGKWSTRPTTDMARESLFNILQNRVEFEVIRVLDLFGGAGGVSFEMYSRGCEDVTYVDHYWPCVKFVKQQSKAFEIGEELKVVKADVFKFISNTEVAYDLIFADPPYAHPRMNVLPDLCLRDSSLNKGGLLVIEHDQNTDFQNEDYFASQRKYGGSIFSFFHYD